MWEVLATTEGVVGSKLAEIGAQLALLGGVALLLGALRLYLASRTGARLVVVVGLALFAVGGLLRGLESLAVLPANYYPGWEADVHEVLHVDHAEFEYAEDDLATDDPRPAWWEGAAWWSQRLALLLGAGLASAGLLLDAQGKERSGGARKVAKTKRAAKTVAR